MTFEEFEILVARHGTDPALWPNPALANDPTVAEWLSAERALEAQLQASPPQLSSNFADRVVDALPAERRSFPGRGAVAAMFLAAAIGVGVLSQSPYVNGPAPEEETEPWKQFAEEAGYADLWAWVEG